MPPELKLGLHVFTIIIQMIVTCSMALTLPHAAKRKESAILTFGLVACVIAAVAMGVVVYSDIMAMANQK